MIASYASLNIFCFKMSACFSWRFYFKTSRKILCPSKKTVVGCFKTVLRLQDRHIFIRQSLEILNVFNLLTFKQFFWKKTLFWKTGVLLFSWKRFEITKWSRKHKVTWDSFFQWKLCHSKLSVILNNLQPKKCLFILNNKESFYCFSSM